MDQDKSTTINLIRDSLLGKCCWDVGSGGAASSTFELALGAKVPAVQLPLGPKHSLTPRQFEGEANLLVWCSWRLDEPARPLSSSDDLVEHVQQALSRLVGTHITTVQIDLPGWDLHLDFANGLRLHVFCDHLPGDPSFDGNWELWLTDQIIAVEAGSRCEVQPRAAEQSAH
jgi:hypothetical protein